MIWWCVDCGLICYLNCLFGFCVWFGLLGCCVFGWMGLLVWVLGLLCRFVVCGVVGLLLCVLVCVSVLPCCLGLRLILLICVGWLR